MNRQPSRVFNPNETYPRVHPLFYTYEPLNYKAKCIRLVRILPGPLDDELRLEIKTVPLGGKYICLSYSWGLPSRHPVLLNGRLASVRDNLDAFLRQARASHIDTWMWIDSLCIDQENDRERNHQVRQMAQIYRGAHHVIMWLGTADTSYTSLQPSSYRNWDSVQHALDTIEEIMPEKQAPNLSHIRQKMAEQIPSLWSSLVCLRDNDYWSRLWITPEVILARRAIVWWRDLEFSWNPLAVLMKLAWGNEKVCPSYSTAAAWELGPPCVATLTDLYHAYKDDMIYIPRFDLHTVLSFVDSLKCEDPRDRVYGMLSLAADGDKIRINYDRSLLSLFLKLRAHWTSLASQGFDVLWAGSCTHLANQLGITAYALEAHILGLREMWHWTPANLLYTEPGKELWYRHRKGSDAQEYRVYSLSSPDSRQNIIQQDAVKAYSEGHYCTTLCSNCKNYADDTCGTLSIIRSKRLKLSLGTGLAPDDHGADSGIQAIRQRLGIYQPETSNTEVALEESVPRKMKPIFLLISEQTRYSHAFVLPKCQQQDCAQRKWVGSARSACTARWSGRLGDESSTPLSTLKVSSKSDRSLSRKRRLRVPGRQMLTKSLAMISS